MSTQDNNKRIARNTVFLYFRMLLLLVVGLYTSRVILATLGIADYGLYNVVGGIVAIFAFLNGPLTTSTQRFLNFELGKGDYGRLKRVFSTALCQHSLLAVIVLIAAETVGLWFVINYLHVETGRRLAAVWVYEFSIIAACVQIIQLPFMSTIIAHERMGVYAYVSIYEAAMKLVIVFALKTANVDKLILYGALYLCVQLSVALIYNFYCRHHFEEARFSFQYDKDLFKEMLSFSSWNVIGSLASVGAGQGINVLFNLFFGTAVNAARGVAYQVNGMITQFSNNFQMAVKPQVVKYYASGQINEMAHLVFNSAKFSAFMLIFISAPVFAEINYLLELWLGKYPEYTPAFIRVILIQSIIISMGTNVIMVVHASGKLRNVGITAGGANLLILPIAYVVLKLGGSPVSALLVGVVGSLIETFIELSWMKYYINFPIKDFYKQVYAYVFPLGFLMFLCPILVRDILPIASPFAKFLIVCVCSVVISSFIFYKWGLHKGQKEQLKRKITKLI